MSVSTSPKKEIDEGVPFLTIGIADYLLHKNLTADAIYFDEREIPYAFYSNSL